MSFSGISTYSFNVLFLTQVISVCSTAIKFNEYITDVGSNISIPCLTHNAFMWIKEECNVTKEFSRDSVLRLYNIQTTESGTYTCLATIDSDDSSSYEALTIVLKVRTAPEAVAKLVVSLSTVLGVLIWEYSSNRSGGYPVKSFTAEFRKYVEDNETEWIRLDPQNIPSNVRYYEVYHLRPNTSYEFRLWANNFLGAGDATTTYGTTLSPLTDQDVFDIILKDVEDFDPRLWLYAVSISVSAVLILGLSVCVMLLRDHFLDLEIKRQQEEDEWGTINIIPNIILNPGYFDAEDPNDPSPPYARTIIFGEDVLSTSESDSGQETPISFKRKFSLFFTGDTVKRL